MSEQHQIASKISKYLDGGKTSKPISKVIAHIYLELLGMRDDGYSWAQILNVINNNQCNFSIESKTLEVTISRIRKRSTMAGNVKTKKDKTESRNAFSSTEEKGKIKHDNNPNLENLLKEIKELKND
ncbi:MAG: hypothetical protein ACRC4K_15925 [Plesiomonas shigelloides]